METREYTLAYGEVKFVGYGKSTNPMFRSDPQMTIYNNDSDEETYIDLQSSDIDKLIEGLKIMKETIPNRSKDASEPKTYQDGINEMKSKALDAFMRCEGYDDFEAALCLEMPSDASTEDPDDMERCENCEKLFPSDQMLHDEEGVPICPECFEEIKDNIDFTSTEDEEES